MIHTLTSHFSCSITSIADSLPDISRWLVTPSNPSRAQEGLDHVRCVPLHNYIVQLGWIGGGRSLDNLEHRSWFERHGVAADNVRNRLKPDPIQFLEQAWDIDRFDKSSFFYWVSGLNSPENLWFNFDPDMVDMGEDWMFLTLYPLNLNLASHSDGLVWVHGDILGSMWILMHIIGTIKTRTKQSCEWISRISISLVPKIVLLGIL